MRILLAALLMLALAPTQPSRPRLLGLAHIGVFVSDLARARVFYADLLGFDEAFTLPGKGGTVDAAFVKINDRQWIELLNRPTEGNGQLDHVALYTDNADGMRAYLGSRGIAVPERIGASADGNRTFRVKDPDGHAIEFVEYVADSLTGRDAGRHLPASRLSSQAIHAGILVGDLRRANAFYADVLGFTEFWRGNSLKSQSLSWVNMRVPDGTDYLEFMLYESMPAPANRGSAHHLCLVVPDVERALAAFESRPARGAYTRELRINTGVNRKRQLNLFDPDGTRVELMEPDTVDGKPAPSSTLPPPRGGA
jgi:catechol 2,3-dioxygenase-like lactoylglutathione lyase family enzyme